MKQSVTVGAQLLWGGRYGCNNGHYGCTIVMSYIEINKAVSQWLLTFNLCVSVTWPLTCAFHIPCTHTPEIIDMHRGMCDNTCTASSVLLLLMSWRPKEPWHQQSWYWLSLLGEGRAHCVTHTYASAYKMNLCGMTFYNFDFLNIIETWFPCNNSVWWTPCALCPLHFDDILLTKTHVVFHLWILSLFPWAYSLLLNQTITCIFFCFFSSYFCFYE